MAKFKVYLRRERTYYAQTEIEADDYDGAEAEADRLVNDYDAYERLEWEGGSYGDPEVDEIDELADEDAVPLERRGFGV